MWIEALLTQDDLARLLARALPLKLHLGEGHSIDLYELGSVKLVADVGLRAVCKARVHWPVLGIELPVVIHSLDVLLRPFIDDTGARLVFGVELEHADIAAVPTIIDNKITDAINAELAARRLDLGWDFATTLSHVFPLPKMVEPLDAIGLQVAWGKIRISDEALVLAISFHAEIDRADEPHRATLWRPTDELSQPTHRASNHENGSVPRSSTRSLWPEAALVGGAFGTAASIAFLGFRAVLRRL